MDKTKSSPLVKANQHPKPVSVFYVWYTELCRRLNINPAPAVKPAKPKCQTVLDFVADRLKIEEWTPVLNALRQDTSLHVVAVRSRIGNCQFLHDVDTEEKARSAKRKYGTIWTAYVLKQLLRSISISLRSTQVLTYLELDGLPLFLQYLEPLLQALKRNQTLKTLSFSNCSIQDAGCQLVCSYLRFTPNIEVLNLSGCHLSPVSGEHLAKLIKYQQINRYCESWHSSLRYENPDAGKMRGIKRISINCNPYFGDAGLNFVLDELEDDLWIKALDMQKCGLTENVAARVLDIVQYNKTLEIVDLRQNELLGMATVEKVLQLLKQRQQFGMQTEFQWCATAVSLTWSSVHSATSFGTSARNVHKTKSAPMRSSPSKVSTVTWDPSVRKTKTVDAIQKNPSNFLSLNDTKKQVLALNEKLQKEIQKRKEMEKRNEELQNQLNQMKTNNVVKVVKTRVPLNGVHQKPLAVRRKEAKKPDHAQTNQPKVVKNGYHLNGVKNNGKTVYDMLEKLLSAGQPLEEDVEDQLLSYFAADQKPSKPKASPPDSLSNSHVSLYKYMEELKTQKT
ncbi:protein Cep78 homolog [Dendroctonus ponderosae]|uniref:Centrosomal protein of 78 kDa n=1 Tax=Dendroctonus ponderosae TaxID=77166 RepID=U4UKY4_DENPD|nr:protein Cep78 homolog [Dendroctonus ponderosae]ERL93153.1 hypothetical protein D910_10450 [Dendroctonus ponderosae]KAH1004842.1 hypothetical protein HUJ05_005611 [Dendroctonus ponderosae]